MIYAFIEVLVVVGIVIVLYFYRMRVQGITTEGEITKILVPENDDATGNDSTPRVYVLYEDENGIDREALLSNAGKTFVGAVVTIRYKPEDKKHARMIDDKRNKKLYSAFMR